MGMLDIAAGSGEGLEKLLSRLLAEEKFEEEKRQNLATEDIQRRNLEENSGWRKLQIESQRDAREQADKQRENDRVARVIAMRPIGSSVTQAEMDRETAAGVPGAVYEHVPPQAPSRSFGSAGEKHNPAMPADIKFKGTQSQLHSAERIADAEERARRVDEDRDANRDIAERREDRITSYGSPVINIFDPNSPTGNRIVPRGSAEVQGGNASAPAAATQTARINAYKRTIGLIDNLLAENPNPDDFSAALGAYDATIGSAANSYLPKGVKDVLGPGLTGGGQKGDKIRTTMEALRAFTSFDEGGKQFTGTEKELLDAFLQDVKSQPEVALQRLMEARKRAQATLDQITQQGSGTTSRIRGIRPRPAGGRP